MEFLEKNISRVDRLAKSNSVRAARPQSKAAKTAAEKRKVRDAKRLLTSQQPGKAKKMIPGLKVGIPNRQAMTV